MDRTLRNYLKLLIVSSFVMLTFSANAKDVASRLGVGYSSQFAEALPAITARYYPNPLLGLSLALGVDTRDNSSRFGVLFKLYRIIFQEDNLNFYLGGGAGLSSYEIVSESKSGFELIGFFGVEFFFNGLPNLGFTFEAGVGVNSNSGGTRFRTIGDHPLRGGVIFYF